MSVGLPVDKNILDARAGNLAWQLRDMLAQARLVKVWLDGKTDAELTALGYQSGEITTLRSAYTDLDKLAQIANAQATQSAANDFFFHARKLMALQ